MSYPPPAYGHHSYGPAPPQQRGGYESRGSPYGQAPPPPADPHYSQYRHDSRGGPPPPPQSSHGQNDGRGAPPPAGYPPPASSGYGSHPPPPPSSEHPPPPAGPAGYPPPSGYGYPPPGYPPHDPHYHSPYGYGGYGAPPPAYGYGAPPPGYGGPYAPPPPGYGHPPPGGGYPPPAAPPDRRRSPRRDGQRGRAGKGDRDGRDRGEARERRDKLPLREKKEKGAGKGVGGKGPDGKGDGARRLNNRRPVDEERIKLNKWLQANPGWLAVWLDGIDPPRRLATTPNVTVLILTRNNVGPDGSEEFGFFISAVRQGVHKKEMREREAARELASALDMVPLENPQAWYQLPPPAEAKRECELADFERLGALVAQRCPKTTIELPEPTSLVLVSTHAWQPGDKEKLDGEEPEMAILEKFDAGFAELLKESRRIGGLVRKQWYVAVVWAKPEPGESARPFPLGVGFATDGHVAKARAVYAAEQRTPILTLAMMTKLPVPPPAPPA